MEKIQRFKTETMIINETRQNLANVISTSGVNVAVMEMILRELLNEVHALAEQTYQKDKAEYESQNISEDNSEKDKQSELLCDSGDGDSE